MKMLALALASVAFCAAPAGAQSVPPIVNPPIVAPLLLPAAPPITNATSNLLFTTMLAIGRAQQANQPGAQQAAYAYAKALERYRAGDWAAADSSALTALTLAVQPALPQPGPVPEPMFASVRVPQTALYGADAPAIDADAFLALARNQLSDCALRKSPQLPAAQAHYVQAQRDFAVRRWQAVRIEAKAAIDACAR